jgi:hypothetical protein
MTSFKICCEASCNYIYEPDAKGKCPKCGSEGIWIGNTVLGRAEDRNVITDRDDKGGSNG